MKKLDKAVAMLGLSK